MRLSSRNPVHRVREYLLAHDLNGLTDGELLGRFAATRNEDAFTLLVRRHTPLVLGTARRVLANAADADDVFQAAFLTLSRKATSLQCDKTLAPWLHQVTFRLALRARKRSRRAVGEPRTVAAGEDPLAQISGRELCSAIDEELARLSDGLRATIVLCCFQGLTRDEAAIQLGWSTPTLKRRLARARAILERRLTTRGITLAAALSPAILSTCVTATAGTNVLATVETVLGKADLPARVSALCGSSVGAWTTWTVLVAATGAMVAGLAIGLQPPTKTPAPPAAVEKPKTDERRAVTVDAHGDPLPAGAVARIGTTRFRHNEWVNHAVWSHDGKNIASAVGQEVIIWDAESGRALHRQPFREPDARKGGGAGLNRSSFVEKLEWSPDGRSLLTVFDGLIQHWAWDATKKTLGHVQTFSSSGDQDSYVAVCFAGDGDRCIKVSPARLGIVDFVRQETGFHVSVATPTDRRTISNATVSPNGLLAVLGTVGERNHLRVYDLNEPQPHIATIDGTATKLAFSGDGKTFAAITEDMEKNLSVEIWDTATWKSRLRFEYPKSADRPAEVRAFALSPDGKTLVTGGADKVLRWWDTTTGKETRKFGPGWVYYNKAAFRPDGKVLMTVSHENHIRLWDVESGRQLDVASGPAWMIAATAITPDGKRILSVSEHTVYAHDASTGRELWHAAEHTDTAVQVVVTPDGKTAITSGNEGLVIFWEVETGKVIRKIANPRHSTDLLALSPDGQTLTALGGEAPHDDKLLRWDVRTGKALEPTTLPAKDSRYAAYALLPAPDGSGVAVASGTELRVPVVSPNGKELVASYGPTDGGVSWAAYSPDSRMIAAATLGDSIYTWETATGQPRLIFKTAGRTTCMAFSPDGRILAIASSGNKAGDEDGTAVRLLDAFTGKEFHRFKGHTGDVYRLAWSMDGRRLVSSSRDSSCLVWDVTAAVRGKLPAIAIDATSAAKDVEVLGTPNATEAYAAMARLTGSPATAVPAIRKGLRPVESPDADKLAALLRDLDSPQFAVRDKATAQLIRLGDGVEGNLRNALTGKLSPEARDRIEKLLMELKPTGDRLHKTRALEVLQRIGDAEALRLLSELAAGADGAWLTAEAKLAAKRVYPNP